MSLGVSRSSVAASKRRSGTPSACAAAITAGSSAFRSSEATQARASRASPAPSRVRCASCTSSSGAQPRSQPRPSASTPGCSTTSPGASRRSVMRRVSRPCSAKGAPPAVSQSAGAASVTRRTGSPASSAAVTAFTRACAPRRQPGGRRVEGEPQGRVARRGDRRPRAEGRRDGAGEPVRAVMAAQQGHDAEPVLRHRDHRRLGALVREVRGEEADEDARGTDADDRRARAEQGGDLGPEALIGHACGGARRNRAVDGGAGKRGRDAPRERRLAPVEDHHGSPAQRHAAPRLWTITMEK